MQTANSAPLRMLICPGTEVRTPASSTEPRAGTASHSRSDSGATATAGPDADESLDDFIARIEEVAIRDALERANQNKTAAAKLLGITFRALRYKLEKLGIE